MWRVEEGGRRVDIVGVGRAAWVVEEGEGMGEEAVRCLPAWTRRISVGGAWVRRERRWRRVGSVVSEGMVSGIAMGEM